MLRVGIIGAGEISKSHAEAYKALEKKVKVVGVADKNVDKAVALAEHFDARVFTNINDLLKEDIDLVDICLPTFLHEEIVIQAASAGIHVFCEKPIALNVEAADRMIQATKKAGVKFMVGQCIRFWPEYVACRKRLERGDLGEIKAITAARVSPAPSWSWNNWILQPDLSGGAVIDLHIHDVDFVNSLITREAEQVMAVGAYSSRGALDHINTLIYFSGGCVASVEGDWLVPEGYPFTMMLRVICEHGTIEFLSQGIEVENRDQSQVQIVVYKPDEEQEIIEITDRKDAYLAEIEYFVDCVIENRNPEVVTPEDARASLKLVLAAQESVRAKKVVNVSSSTS